MFRWVIAITVGVASAVAAFGSTPPVLTLDAAVHGNVVLLTATSHADAVRDVTLSATSSGDLLGVDTTPVAVHLSIDVPVTVPIPAAIHLRGKTGTLIVRATNEHGTIAVVEVPYGNDQGRLGRLTHAAYTGSLQASIEESAAQAAEQRAGALLRRVLARGGKPSVGGHTVGDVGQAVENSMFDQAWSRLVKQLMPTGNTVSAASGARPLACGGVYPSPANRTIPVSGSVTYDNARFGSHYPLYEAGFPGHVRTIVEYIDDCENVEYRERSFDFSTSSYGGFSTTATTIDDPNDVDPLLAVVMLTPDAGVLVSGNFTSVHQTLYPPADGFQYVNGTILLSPYYSQDVAPDRYLFYWDDVIKSLQNRWNGDSLPGGYSQLLIALDSSAQQPSFAMPNLITTGDFGMWSSRWILAHEAGHFLQYKLQGDHLNSGSQHDFCSSTSYANAFQEGFADWHASYYESDARDAYVHCDGGECYSTCSAGYTIEDNVMGFFWDLFDSDDSALHDSYYDPMTQITHHDSVFPYALSKLTEFRTDRAYDSFYDFYSDYQSRGLWSPNPAGVDSLRLINNVQSP